MKALVLAAGLGTRLGQLTKDKPKCLMEAGGVTILDHVCGKLKKAGVTEIIINLYYQSEQIIAHVEKQNSWGIKVHFSREETLLGTGGAIRRVAHHFADQKFFLVHNSDVYSDISIEALIEYHKRAQTGVKKSLVTLAVLPRATSRPLLFDTEGYLAGWENTKEGTGARFGSEVELTPYGYACIHVANPEILKFFEGYEDPFSLMSPYLEAAQQGERVLAYQVNEAFWIDIGTPQKLAELQSLLQPKNLLN